MKIKKEDLATLAFAKKEIEHQQVVAELHKANYQNAILTIYVKYGLGLKDNFDDQSGEITKFIENIKQ